MFTKQDDSHLADHPTTDHNTLRRCLLLAAALLTIVDRLLRILPLAAGRLFGLFRLLLDDLVYFELLSFHLRNRRCHIEQHLILVLDLTVCWQTNTHPA